MKRNVFGFFCGYFILPLIQIVNCFYWIHKSVCMILGGSTLKGELLHRRLLGLKSRKMCSKAADNMSSNEALHHFTTTSGNFGWLQGDIFCQTDVLLSLGNDTYMTAALNPLSPLWKAKNLLWRIFYLIKNSPIVSFCVKISLENMKCWYRFDSRKRYKENYFRPSFISY